MQLQIEAGPLVFRSEVLRRWAFPCLFTGGPINFAQVINRIFTFYICLFFSGFALRVLINR